MNAFRTLCAVAGCLFLLAGCTSGRGFKPPRMVDCHDIDLLNGTRTINPVHVGVPAGNARYAGAGFSVQPPSGPGWCRSLSLAEALEHPPANERFRFTFIKNNYWGKLLDKAPGDLQRGHTFLVYAVVGRPPGSGKWTIGDLQKYVESTHNPKLILLSSKASPTTKFGAKCVWSEKLLRLPWKENFLLREDGYTCIHPTDPRYVVSVVASERWVEGSPYYHPFLMDSLEPEYRRFFDSLEFTTDLPPEPVDGEK